MAKDYTNLFYQVVNGPEFAAFLDRTGEEVNSGKTQIKRGTIQTQDAKATHRWLFFTNGYVREQTPSGWGGDFVAKVLSKPPAGWDNDNVTYDMMVGQIDKAHARLDKREKTIRDRAAKLMKKAPMVFEALFDPEKYEPYNNEYNRKFDGFWLNGTIEQIMDSMYSACCSTSKDSYQRIKRK